MIGSNSDVHLSATEKEDYYQRLEQIRNSSNGCKKILKDDLSGRVDLDYIEALNLELTVAPPRHEERTNAAILDDISWLFARFKSASNLIYKSAKEMHEWELRDSGQHLEYGSQNIVEAIYATLRHNDIDPPDEPTFPGLEEKLNHKTEDFLGAIQDCLSYTDNVDQNLICLVRNYAIVEELLSMIDIFKRDLAAMNS